MGYKIISGKYETGTLEQQIGYTQLFGVENIQEKFDLYFHWFNIVHEIGHVVVDIQKTFMDKVDEELFVNRFAVSYWRTVDACNNLNKLQNMIGNILKSMPSPVPKNKSFREFFKGIWGTEQMNSVMMYGYFQLACVAEAFKESKTIDDVLAEVGYENINMTLIEKYSEEVSSENCIKVLKKCVDNLNSIGVKLTAINIEFVDNPEVQCCQPE